MSDRRRRRSHFHPAWQSSMPETGEDQDAQETWNAAVSLWSKRQGVVNQETVLDGRIDLFCVVVVFKALQVQAQDNW